MKVGERSAALVLSLCAAATMAGNTKAVGDLLDQQFLPPSEPIPIHASIGADESPTDSPDEPVAPSGLEPGEPIPLIDDRPSEVLQALPVTSSAPSVEVESGSSPINVEEPNREGVIQLGASTVVASVAQNPFDFRVRTVDVGRDVKLRVGGVFGGKRPAALVNGRIVTKGDRIEGFNVVLVSKLGVVMEKDGQFFRVPRGRDTLVKENRAP